MVQCVVVVRSSSGAPTDIRCDIAARLFADESRLTTLRAEKAAGAARLGVRVDPDDQFRVLAVNDSAAFGAQLGLRVDDRLVRWQAADVVALSDLRLEPAAVGPVECVVLRAIDDFSIWSMNDAIR